MTITKRKYLSFLFVFLLLTSSTNVFAMNNFDDSLIPCYEPQCGSYATHNMRNFNNIVGELRTKDGETHVLNGYVYQCSRCKLLCVTERRAKYENIGKYGVSSWKYYLEDPSLATRITISVDNICTSNSPGISGMTFVYN